MVLLDSWYIVLFQWYGFYLLLYHTDIDPKCCIKSGKFTFSALVLEHRRKRLILTTFLNIFQIFSLILRKTMSNSDFLEEEKMMSKNWLSVTLWIFLTKLVFTQFFFSLQKVDTLVFIRSISKMTSENHFFFPLLSRKSTLNFGLKIVIQTLFR